MAAICQPCQDSPGVAESHRVRLPTHGRGMWVYPTDPNVYLMQMASNGYPNLFPRPREFRRGGRPQHPGPLPLTLGIKARQLGYYDRRSLRHLPTLPKPEAGDPGAKARNKTE